MPSRTAKRKRTSLAVPPDSLTVESRHATFTQWALDRGVEINGVKPANLTGRGYGLVTTRAIKNGERVLFIPEKAMFKPDSRFLQKHALDRASPQAQLAISALAHFKAPASRTGQWQATWPTVEDFKHSLPMNWSQRLVDQLPPSVHQPLERQREDYVKDWQCVKALCQNQEWTEMDFKYFWMIVNSRSFHWKPPKARSGSMVMCPFVDYLNHGPSGTTCDVFQRANGYEVIADRDYDMCLWTHTFTKRDVNTELLATYGSHVNDKLLVHYGFVLPGTASTDDDIRLDHLLLPKLSEGTRTQLQDVGFLGSYALLPAPRNELCFKTQVAVRAVLLSSNEWEYFVTTGEDLSTDKTAAVRDFIVPILKEYREDAELHVKTAMEIDRAGNPEQRMAVGVLTERWNQIVSAIDHFLAA